MDWSTSLTRLIPNFSQTWKYQNHVSWVTLWSNQLLFFKILIKKWVKRSVLFSVTIVTARQLQSQILGIFSFFDTFLCPIISFPINSKQRWYGDIVPGLLFTFKCVSQYNTQHCLCNSLLYSKCADFYIEKPLYHTIIHSYCNSWFSMLFFILILLSVITCTYQI